MIRIRLRRSTILSGLRSAKIRFVVELCISRNLSQSIVHALLTMSLYLIDVHLGMTKCEKTRDPGKIKARQGNRIKLSCSRRCLPEV